MTLPRASVKKGKVLVLSNEKLLERTVEQVGSKPDSVFITGLKNGEFVVMEELEKVDLAKKYIGIKR